MSAFFKPRLINDQFDDPGVFVPLCFEKRAMLFDLGDIGALSARDILKISHIFVSHTHMDHFVGFDRLLRLFLGRNKTLFIYGPKGFFQNLAGKLASYTWNLVEKFTNNFTIQAFEVHPDRILTCTFTCRSGFIAGQSSTLQFKDNILLAEPSITVYCNILDHGIPCLGFSLKERFHISIKKASLEKLGLKPGPWLARFKDAVYNGLDPAQPFEVDFEVNHNDNKMRKIFQLQELIDNIALITPGQKITYITDVLYSPENKEKMLQLGKNSSHLFIEAAFLEKDKSIAAAKFHLTAAQAGHIAALAGAKKLTIFHFSPRYTGMKDILEKEAMSAYKALDHTDAQRLRPGKGLDGFIMGIS